MTVSVLMIIGLPIMLIIAMLVFVLVDRYIRYKERVALAQLGFSLEEIRHGAGGSRGSRGVLWGGVITAMSGLALLVGLSTLGLGVWLVAGFLPLFVGLGMILIYFMTSDSAAPAQPPEQIEDMGLEQDAEPLDDPLTHYRANHAPASSEQALAPTMDQTELPRTATFPEDLS